MTDANDGLPTPSARDDWAAFGRGLLEASPREALERSRDRLRDAVEGTAIRPRYHLRDLGAVDLAVQVLDSTNAVLRLHPGTGEIATVTLARRGFECYLELYRVLRIEQDPQSYVARQWVRTLNEQRRWIDRPGAASAASDPDASPRKSKVLTVRDVVESVARSLEGASPESSAALREALEAVGSRGLGASQVRKTIESIKRLPETRSTGWMLWSHWPLLSFQAHPYFRFGAAVDLQPDVARALYDARSGEEGLLLTAVGPAFGSAMLCDEHLPRRADMPADPRHP